MDGPVDVTEQIIKCAIEVHRALGPGFRERTYEEALAIEMLLQGVQFTRQVCIPVHYKGRIVGDYNLDFVVAETAVVELKAVDGLDRVFEAQVLGYLKACGTRSAGDESRESHVRPISAIPPATPDRPLRGRAGRALVTAEPVTAGTRDSVTANTKLRALRVSVLN
jgi:GxxExxY protein